MSQLDFDEDGYAFVGEGKGHIGWMVSTVERNGAIAHCLEMGPISLFLDPTEYGLDAGRFVNFKKGQGFLPHLVRVPNFHEKVEAVFDWLSTQSCGWNYCLIDDFDDDEDEDLFDEIGLDDVLFCFDDPKTAFTFESVFGG